MEQILLNLQDPAWWFTGTFFVVVGLILGKLFSSWIPSVLGFVSGLWPKITTQIIRRKALKTAKIIKRYRQHEVKVNWLISRYWCLATIMFVYSIFALIMFSLYPKEDGIFANKLVPVMLFLPAYALQLLTISEKKELLKVMNAHINWKKRITRSGSAT